MRITLQSTPITSVVQGKKVRCWRGITDRGIQCDVFILEIAARLSYEREAFDAEIAETDHPESVQYLMARENV